MTAAIITGIAGFAVGANAQPVRPDSAPRHDSTHLLAPVTVTATRNAVLDGVGFSMRMEHGTGHYITEKQLAKMSNFSFTDLLRGIPGLRVGINKFGEDVVAGSTRSGGSPLSESYGCVQYVVDGVAWDGGATMTTTPLVRNRSSDDPMSVYGAQLAYESARQLNNFLKKADILGIEVYSGPGTPAQYNQGGSNCATVIVWTKENVRAIEK